MDDVNVRVFSDRAEVSHCLIGANQRAPLLGSCLAACAHVGDARSQRRRMIEQRQGEIAIGMHAANETEAKYSNAIKVLHRKSRGMRESAVFTIMSPAWG